MLAAFGASSKLNAEWAFVSRLREEGRKAANEFLEAHGADLGVRSTADLDILLTEC
jgi:NTE family protein